MRLSLLYVQQELVGTELEKALQIGVKQKRAAAIKEIEEKLLGALTEEGVRKQQAVVAAAEANVPEEVQVGTWEEEEDLVEDGLVDESDIHVTSVPRKLVMEVCSDFGYSMQGISWLGRFVSVVCLLSFLSFSICAATERYAFSLGLTCDCKIILHSPVVQTCRMSGYFLNLIWNSTMFSHRQ